MNQAQTIGFLRTYINKTHEIEARGLVGWNMRQWASDCGTAFCMLGDIAMDRLAERVALPNRVLKPEHRHSFRSTCNMWAEDVGRRLARMARSRGSHPMYLPPPRKIESLLFGYDVPSTLESLLKLRKRAEYFLRRELSLANYERLQAMPRKQRRCVQLALKAAA